MGYSGRVHVLDMVSKVAPGWVDGIQGADGTEMMESGGGATTKTSPTRTTVLTPINQQAPPDGTGSHGMVGVGGLGWAGLG